MRKPNFLQLTVVDYAARKLQNIPILSKCSILISLTLAAIALTFAIGPVPQSLAYHQFADHRTYWKIPNFFNVITNLPFIVIGFWGILQIQKSRAQGIHFINYFVLFLSIFLTGFGSAFYHLHPNNATLVCDRMPLAILFIAFLSIALAECINQLMAMILLLPLLILGIGSVLFWYYSEVKSEGDLRLYGFIQFYTIYIIPVIAFLFPTELFRKGISALLWINVTYAIAKFCELFDKEIYSMLYIISGHSLKHIFASVSAIFILKMFEKKFLK